MLKQRTSELIRHLMSRNLKIAFAESVTCGYLTHQLSTAKGTSDVLEGSVICYNEEVKKSLLGISPAMLKKHTAESQRVTDEMARKLSRLIKADIYVAVTGLATDGGSETKTKPVGTVFITVFVRKKLFRLRKRYYGKPLDIKKKATADTFYLLLKILKSNFNTYKK